MVTLHGFSLSNYYNMVKHMLLFKGCDFEENKLYPQDPNLLAICPTGKVPAMTTSCGAHLFETSVILEYIEERYPTPSLYPNELVERSRVRELNKVLELYLDIPARRLLPFALRGGEPDSETLQKTYETCLNGCLVVNNLCSMSPYAMGSSLSVADIFMRYALVVPQMVKVFWKHGNPLEKIDGLHQWELLLSDSDISKKIDQDSAAARPEFMARVRAS